MALFTHDIHPDAVVSIALSGFVGLLLGIVVSLVVNCTLVEISISAFFSFYFGVLFIIVGVLILWRVKTNVPGSRQNTLSSFAMVIICAGVLCFFLEHKWYFQLSPVFKIPMYSLVGVAVAFALTFSMVDVINDVVGFLQPSIAKPLVESPRQIELVLFTALLMGGIFGFIFGLMDIEDAMQYQIRLRLLQEEHYCFPIGGLLGAIAGAGNEYLREFEGSSPHFFSEVRTTGDAFNEDI